MGQEPRRIDLVRDGLPADVLTANGSGKRLFGALVSTAMWAQQHGMTEAQWCGLLDEPRSRLGAQNRTRRNGTPEAPKRSRDRLARAWASAAAHISERPRWTRDGAQQAAREAAQVAVDLAADPDSGLTDSERALLAAVAKIADDRGSDRLTLPRQTLLDSSGLGLTALRTALRRLSDRGLLVLVEPGRPREKGRPKRAAVYRLACRPNPESGVGVPPALSSGAPGSAPTGAPAPVSGAPTPEESNMQEITLTREQIVTALGQAALDALLAQAVEAEQPTADVVPLRPHEPRAAG